MITILAIISLIVIPIFLNIISDTKSENIKKSVILYVDSIEKNIAARQVIDPDYEPDECLIQNNGNIICSLEGEILETNTDSNELEINDKGKKTTSGTVLLSDGKIIEMREIYFDDKYVNYDEEDNSVKIYLHPMPEIAGLYDENRELVATWNQLEDFGFNISSSRPYPNANSSTMFKTIINEHPELKSGRILVIPNNVTMGNFVFYNVDTLTDVIILDGVTKISSSAFYGCLNLKSIKIPDSVTSIGQQAFYETNLSSIKISENVTEISSGAFGIGRLSKIKVDSNNTVYEDRNSNAIIEKSSNKLISGCKNTLIPDGITSIGDYAFSKSEITKITLPNSIASIGEYAFAYSKLTSIIIPNGVTSISENTFTSCEDLTSVTIPESVTSIKSRAFIYCTSLANITIPSSVTEILYKVFSYCDNLQNATFENTSGWFISNSPDDINATNIDVTNSSTNAINLKDTYNEKYWKRN